MSDTKVNALATLTCVVLWAWILMLSLGGAGHQIGFLPSLGFTYFLDRVTSERKDSNG